VTATASRRRGFDAGAAFVAAERPALIPVAERIRRELGVGRERGGGVLLGAALRPIAEAEGGGVVPPAARIVGRSGEDFVADVGALEADANELHEVLRREPDREPPPVHRHIAEIADADAGDAQSVLERIKRAERLAERLADAVAGIGTHRAPPAHSPPAR